MFYDGKDSAVFTEGLADPGIMGPSTTVKASGSILTEHVATCGKWHHVPEWSNLHAYC